MYYATNYTEISHISLVLPSVTKRTLRYAMTENSPNCAFKIMYSYMWNCFCLLEGRDVNRENNNRMDAEAGLKEMFLAKSQHSGCTDVEVG